MEMELCLHVSLSDTSKTNAVFFLCQYHETLKPDLEVSPDMLHFSMLCLVLCLFLCVC